MRLPDDPLLTWSEDGAPRSGRYDDVYFSRGDGLAETRSVFLQGCGLPGAWRNRPRHVAAELGFGSGLNIAALLDLWRRERNGAGRLHVFTIEAHPLSRDEAARALAAFPEVAEAAAALLAGWPPGTPGFHRIDLPEWSATVDLAIGDAAWALSQWIGLADSWFLDGFAPARNPAMWSDGVLDGVRARSAPGARLATFTVAGAVRRGLADRGFEVAKRPGHGRKRERLEAWLAAAGSPPQSSGEVAVIGAGIAGAAVARALAAEGRDVVEVQDPAAPMASAFPASLVTPRFDLGDDAVAGLYAQALERAAALYRRLPDAVIAQGVQRLAKDARERDRFGRIAEQPLWPSGALRPDDQGLFMHSAQVVDGAVVRAAWQSHARRVIARVDRFDRDGDEWRLIARDGSEIARAAQVVIACGWGTAGLLPDLDLRAVRGQADWVRDVSARATTWGGYVAPTRDGLLYGATHQRGDIHTDVREADSVANLATLSVRLPDLASEVAAHTPDGRHAAIRATTRDHLPVCGLIDEGLAVLSGLGGRGFCLAPLLGEHLAAELSGAPSPLPADVSRRLSPLRFMDGRHAAT